MYAFVTHTGNAIKGKCKHECPYCYMIDLGVFYPIKLDYNELQGNMDEPKAKKKYILSSMIYRENKSFNL